jgi:hypothetical protein
MSFRDIKFDHTEDNFHLALGVTPEIKNICRERIFFASLSNALQADELFDDMDDAPKEFKTVTGDLQRLISMITNPIEYDYTLLVFMMYQRMAKEVYSHYRNTKDDPAATLEDQVKMQIIKGIMKLKEIKDREESGESNTDDDDSTEVLSKESLTERISLIKKSGYNFDKYLNLLQSTNIINSRNKPSDFDISDLLSGLFSKDDGDDD